MATKRQDTDLLALKRCVKALDKSSSKKMLTANLVFLWDRYLVNPTKETINKMK